MRRRGISILLCLSLGLALAGLTAASAMAGVRLAARGPVADMVICAGEGTRTIRLDRAGAPVEDDCAAPCPLCLATLACAAAAGCQPVASPPGTADLQPLAPLAAPPPTPRTVQARGPPPARG